MNYKSCGSIQYKKKTKQNILKGAKGSMVVTELLKGLKYD